ncbi:flagellar brake protein [Paenibacillus athensensis]|nr:PilZ domain-containing protein [Paenibacillus athensensis]
MLIRKMYESEPSQFYGSKEGSDAAVLIDSKTVLEKKDFVATGILTYALGDIIEVELPQYNVFHLGDKVKLTVYTKSGLFVFESTIVAKDNGALIVINPPENRKKFTEKRDFPRIDITQGGVLHTLHDTIRSRRQRLEKPMGISIKNISMSGIGFTLDSNLLIENQTRLEVELNLGFSMPCIAEVVRKETLDSGLYYGAKYIEVPREKTNALRAFILKSQVETYFVRKREESHMKAVSKKPVASE